MPPLGRSAWAVFLLCLLAGGFDTQAAWGSVSAKYGTATGSRSFQGHALDITLADGSGFIGGGFETYRSDHSSGTVRTYLLNMGGGPADARWKVFGSLTQEVDSYRSKGVGLELVSGLPAEEGDAGARTAARFSYARTWHTDGLPVPQDTQQDDLGGGLIYTSGKTLLDIGFVKSLYAQDVESRVSRPVRYSRIPGTVERPQEYPSYTVSGRLEQGLLSWLRIWGSYARIKYKTGASESADAYSVGAGTAWKSLRLSVDYNQFTPSEGANTKYVTTEVGLAF